MLSEFGLSDLVPFHHNLINVSIAKWVKSRFDYCVIYSFPTCFVEGKNCKLFKKLLFFFVDSIMIRIVS